MVEEHIPFSVNVWERALNDIQICCIKYFMLAYGEMWGSYVVNESNT